MGLLVWGMTSAAALRVADSDAVVIAVLVTMVPAYALTARVVLQERRAQRPTRVRTEGRMKMWRPFLLGVALLAAGVALAALGGAARIAGGALVVAAAACMIVARNALSGQNDRSRR